jgi:hypothetical protein
MKNAGLYIKEVLTTPAFSDACGLILTGNHTAAAPCNACAAKKRLAEAAPKLLAALEWWVNYKGNNCDMEFEPIALDAIREATGE